MASPLVGSVGQGTTDISTALSNRQVIDMSELIKFVHDDIAPFTRIVSTVGFEEAIAEKHEWMESDDIPAFITITTASAAGATTITSSAGYKLVKKNTMLYCKRTNETFFVGATPSAAAMASIVPNMPTGSGGSALVVGDQLIILPTAMEYGSSPVAATYIEPGAAYNYVQKCRESWKVDGRVQASKLYGPTALEYAKTTHLRNFLKMRERQLLFGVRGRTASAINGVGTITQSAGVKYFMDNNTNVTQMNFANTAVTKSNFNTFLKEAFRYGDSPKVGICGWNIMQIINDWANSKVFVLQDAKALGVNIMRYETAFGTLDLIPHKSWNLEFGMEDEMWVLPSLSDIKRFGLAGRSEMTLTTTRGSDQLQAEGEDAVFQELTIEDGIMIRNTERMARAYNIGK